MLLTVQEIETFLDVGEQGMYGGQSATSIWTVLLVLIIRVCVFVGDRDVFRGG